MTVTASRVSGSSCANLGDVVLAARRKLNWLDDGPGANFGGATWE